MPKKKSYFFYLTLLFLISIVVYSIVISILPSFYFDDYEIFAEISNADSKLLYFNPVNHFFLSLRPVSYLLLKIDYFLWGTNAIGMKINGIILHVVLIVIYFKILILISQFLKIEINYKIIIVFSFLFSLNPESSVWIFIINNQTELLGTLFYALSIFYLLKYTINDSNSVNDLVSYFFFYAISVYSKQQSFHLPLLIIYLLYLFRGKITKAKFRNALLISCLGLTLMVFVSWLNVSFTYYHLTFSDFIKKPFAVLGILFYSIFPVLTDYIYYFALFNRQIVVLIVIIFLLIVGIMIKRKVFVIKNILFVLAGYLIILYPRIYIGYSERINSIIIFWTIILLFIFYSKIISLQIKKIVLTIYSIIIIAALALNVKNYQKHTEILDRQRYALAEFMENNREVNRFYIVCSFMQYINPYENYFYHHHAFGIDKRLTPLPITCYSLSSIFFHNNNEEIIKVRSIDKKLIIDVASPKFILRADPFNKLFPNYNITSLNRKERSYSKIIMDMSNNLEINFASVIYFDGTVWRFVNK